MTKQKTIIASLIVLAILILIAVISESKTHYIARLFDNFAMDNKKHYLSCDQLPKVIDIDKVVEERKNIVEQIIKEVGARNRGSEATPLWKDSVVTDGENFYISFSWGESQPDCYNTGRGDIEITYSGHEDRIIIEKIINGDTFFGVPYRLINM